MNSTPFKIPASARAIAVYFIGIALLVATVKAIPSDDPKECIAGHSAGNTSHVTYCIKGE